MQEDIDRQARDDLMATRPLKRMYIVGRLANEFGPKCIVFTYGEGGALLVVDRG